MEEDVNIKDSNLFSVNDLNLINLLSEKEIITEKDVVFNETISEEETRESLQYKGIRNMLLFKLDQEFPDYENYDDYLNGKIYKRFKNTKSAMIEKVIVENTFKYDEFRQIDYILHKLGFNTCEIKLFNEHIVSMLYSKKTFTLTDLIKEISSNIDREDFRFKKMYTALKEKNQTLLDINNEIKEDKIKKLIKEK